MRATYVNNVLSKAVLVFESLDFKPGDFDSGDKRGSHPLMNYLFGASPTNPLNKKNSLKKTKPLMFPIGEMNNLRLLFRTPWHPRVRRNYSLSWYVC